ncbi:hypothetical protein L3556_02420 [Candidatus Synechococcus calcipolaris G9]|uniref:Uncharacterized protein n=1 Tax=Candidatus Synechococcus calcipolaris G9 TaxID=1497997 RepID=A0ABT6EX30_9SYNE|nr:hypothetical protein [Candidatus Synechococcus calcipolaris]MDG2989796.1 hypothetical protein [Candidatus Synechococcus calcipolaris G9]
MQDKNFEDIKERIEIGLSNDFPLQSRLIMLGEIFCSVGHGLITPNQGYELEDLLGLDQLIEDYDRVREMGFSGEFVSVA